MWTRFSTLLAAAALAATIVGCGGAATTPPPTPSPTPAPTPSPTPDPAALAIELFAAKDLRAHVELDGTATIGTATMTSTGTMDVIGDSEHEDYETKVNGQPYETKEVISLGTDEWEKVSDGPWHESDGTNDTPMVDDLAELTALTVVGDETLDGTAVIHVRPGPGVTLNARGWGPSYPVEDWKLALDLWIRNDGALVKTQEVSSFVQRSGDVATTVEMTQTSLFSPLSSTATIAAPDDPWVAYTSTQGYTLSQPAGYTTTTEGANDQFIRGDVLELSVASGEADPDMTLDEYVKALADGYAKQVGAKVTLVYETTVDSRAAQIAVFEGETDQGAFTLADAVVLANGRYWEIYVVGTQDTLRDDVDHLNWTLTTFEFAS